jgi:methylmalonyl-CoA mutase cobalamin-binding subunit
LRRAAAEQAEAILVSQVVTQKNVHIHNLMKLIELAEAEGVRDRYLMIVGGPVFLMYSRKNWATMLALALAVLPSLLLAISLRN